MIHNWYFFSRFILGILVLGAYVGFLLPRQWKETFGYPFDVYSRLRAYIFTLLWVIILTSLPSVLYTLQISFGHDYKIWRNIVNITAGIKDVALAAALVLFSTYKVRK